MDAMILGFIILGALVLFFTERIEVEITALLVLLSLILSGILTSAEALTGFSSEATIVITGLLVMSAAIERTGALHIVARKILRFSQHDPTRIIITMMMATGAVSMFVNNTPAVAVQLPIAISLAEKVKVSLSKLLMPISFAAILGGTCTMIGTSTNVLVRTMVRNHDPEWELGIFEITPIGLMFFLAGILYLVFIGRKLIPDRRTDTELAEKYKLREYLTEFIVNDDCYLIGQPIREQLPLPDAEESDVDVIEVIRGTKKFLTFGRFTIESGDRLLVHGKISDLMKFKEKKGLSIRHDFVLQDSDLKGDRIVLAEGVLSPSSHLLNQTLEEINFKHRFGVVGLAISRHGKIIPEKVGKVRLEFGDTLLLQGEPEKINQLMDSPDFLILERIKLPPARPAKIPLAVSSFLLVIVLIAFGLMPMVPAVITGALLMILTGCVSLKELYESVPFKVIILLGCLIPLGLAMEKTGAARMVAEQIVELPFQGMPRMYLLTLALVTLALTELMTNNATAIIMIPVAFSVAAKLGVSAHPLVIAVMFAASFSFLTPVGYQTNTIIYAPGGYQFSDFARVGAPLTFMLLLINIFLVPVFWPF